MAASIVGNSLFDVEIGASLVSAAEKLDSYQIDNHDGNDNGCFYLKPASGNSGARFMILNGVVARIEVVEADTHITIGNGLGIGSTKQEIISNYANAIVSPHPYAFAGEYLRVFFLIIFGASLGPKPPLWARAATSV